jgi:hypothetical protein
MGADNEAKFAKTMCFAVTVRKRQVKTMIRVAAHVHPVTHILGHIRVVPYAYASWQRTSIKNGSDIT